MKPSNRISNVPTYYFAKKLAEIAEMNKNKCNVINLGIGSPDLNTPDDVLTTLKTAIHEKGASQYQPYIGVPELRDAFAAWYEKIYHVHLNPNTELLPVMGSKEAIMHIHLAFCNPGDMVLIPNPGYPTYGSTAKLLGLNIHTYDLKEENNWMPSLNDLEKLDLSKCKVMWINYPNMPTGATASKEALNQLVAFAQEHNILLVNDNPYSLIRNNAPLSIHSCSNDYPEVIELNSLSKAYNMAGWRVGIITASEENIQYLLRVKSNFDSGMYKPIQIAAAKALSLDQSWFEQQNNEYQERAKIAYEILDQLGCTYDKHSSGMFIWAKIPNNYLSGASLSDEILHQAKVFITPGFVFGDNGDQYIRLSLCSDRPTLIKALNRIKNARK